MTLVIYAAVSLKDEQLGVCEFGSRMELSLKEGVDLRETAASVTPEVFWGLMGKPSYCTPDDIQILTAAEYAERFGEDDND